MNNKKFIIPWDQFYRDSKALAWRLGSRSGAFRAMVCITRGGMIPASIIAQELNIRVLDTICVSSYDAENKRGELHLIKSISPEVQALYDEDPNSILVVDDLVDTGETFKLIRQLLPGAHYACIYAKPIGHSVVDCFITEVSQDTWIVLPQEVG
jgi:xanthine phosphoribosyltransferase